jgi:hypothetical protein
LAVPVAREMLLVLVVVVPGVVLVVEQTRRLDSCKIQKG